MFWWHLYSGKNLSNVHWSIIFTWHNSPILIYNSVGFETSYAYVIYHWEQKQKQRRISHTGDVPYPFVVSAIPYSQLLANIDLILGPIVLSHTVILYKWNLMVCRVLVSFTLCSTFHTCGVKVVLVHFLWPSNCSRYMSWGRVHEFLPCYLMFVEGVQM